MDGIPKIPHENQVVKKQFPEAAVLGGCGAQHRCFCPLPFGKGAGGGSCPHRKMQINKIVFREKNCILLFFISNYAIMVVCTCAGRSLRNSL